MEMVHYKDYGNQSYREYFECPSCHNLSEWYLSKEKCDEMNIIVDELVTEMESFKVEDDAS